MDKPINTQETLEGNLKPIYGNRTKKMPSGSRKPRLDKLKKLLDRMLGRNVYGS